MKAERVVAIGSALLGTVALAMAISKEVKAKPICRDMQPGQFYYFIYVGDKKTFMAALGECYPVIYTIDVWSEGLGDWIPPADPMNDILEPGNECRVWVQEPCNLCGFVPMLPEQPAGLSL